MAGHEKFDLERLFGEIVLSSSEGKFAFNMICEFFRASAGTFWKQDLDTEEYDAIDFFNRPNRLLDDEEYSFSLSENEEQFSLATKKVFDSRNYLVETIGNPPFDSEWKGKTIVADIVHYKKIAIIPIFNQSHSPIASISLYDDEFHGRINDKKIVNEFILFMSKFISGPAAFGEKVVSERRKIGHEIKRQLQLLDNKIDDTRKKIETGDINVSKKELLRDFNDMRAVLKTSKNSIGAMKFVEGVIRRQSHSKRTNFRKLHNMTSHSLKKDARRILNTALIMRLEDFSLWIAASDLDLMISNILENAIKYNLPGGYVSASVEFLPESGGVKYKVNNLSQEIPSSELRKIWLLGQRGSNTVLNTNEKSKAISGEGVGLAVISDICRVYDIKRELIQRKSKRNKTLYWTELSLDFPEEMVSFSTEMGG